MKRALILRLVLGLILVCCLPSCGFAFRSAWKKGGYAVSPTGPAIAAGASSHSLPQSKWAGTWLSDASGHHGALRCVTSNTMNGMGDHEFFYHATWKTILSGSYKAVHRVQKQKDGTYTFTGEHKMPNWAGGLYHYEGTIKGDEFKASYRCSMDNGTYTMKRVR
jgi:hypothetical protein